MCGEVIMIEWIVYWLLFRNHMFHRVRCGGECDDQGLTVACVILFLDFVLFLYVHGDFACFVGLICVCVCDLTLCDLLLWQVNCSTVKCTACNLGMLVF